MNGFFNVFITRLNNVLTKLNFDQVLHVTEKSIKKLMKEVAPARDKLLNELFVSLFTDLGYVYYVTIFTAYYSLSESCFFFLSLSRFFIYLWEVLFLNINHYRWLDHYFTNFALFSCSRIMWFNHVEWFLQGSVVICGTSL